MFNKIVLILIVLLHTGAFSQILLPKNYKGEYNIYTLYSNNAAASKDTSQIIEVPHDVSTGIFYFNLESVSTADTLKSIVFEGSPDMVTWYSIQTISDKTAPHKSRFTLLPVDKYIRFYFDIGGTSPLLKLNVKVYPKK